MRALAVGGHRVVVEALDRSCRLVEDIPNLAELDRKDCIPEQVVDSQASPDWLAEQTDCNQELQDNRSFGRVADSPAPDLVEDNPHGHLRSAGSLGLAGADNSVD